MSGTSSPDREERARRLLRTLSEHDRAREVEQADSPPSMTRYEIRGRIGEGATAIVYRAWDRELHRSVAVKALKEKLGLLEPARQRFRRESRAAAGLSHPNIVQVYDVGEENGRLYIVMELVEGRPLSETLQGPPAPLRERLSLLEKVARGVAAAHARGVIHRDLKPANILVTATGEPKVADFGLAHLLGGEEELTRTGSTLGTPLYMAPEQVRGQAGDITARTDVYALGTILYELLTKSPPHRGETPLALYERILNDDPAPVRQLWPAAPEDLDTIALKALARNPAERYPSAAEFAEDLRRFAAGEPISARPASVLEKLWRQGVRHRRVVFALSAASVFVLLVGLLWTRSQAPPSGPSAFVEEAVGEVSIVGESKTTRVGKGYGLHPGQLLLTGPSSSTVLNAPGLRLALAPETSLQELTAQDRASYFVALGTVTAESGRPVSLRTPLIHATFERGSVRLEVFPTLTWLTVLDGDAIRVHRVRDGKSLVVRGGFFVAVDGEREFAPRPVSEGLLGYWPFEDAAGSVVRDASGRGKDGLLHGGPAAAEGRKGKGAEFDGTTSLEVPGLSGGAFPPGGTLAFWVKGDFRSRPVTGLLDAGDESRRHFVLRTVRETPGLQLACEGGGPARVAPLLPLPDGQWAHVAVVWNSEAGNVSLYLNGKLHGSDTLPKDWVPDGQAFRVGGFRGVLDELRLYGSPLGPEALRNVSAP